MSTESWDFTRSIPVTYRSPANLPIAEQVAGQKVADVQRPFAGSRISNFTSSSAGVTAGPDAISRHDWDRVSRKAGL